MNKGVKRILYKFPIRLQILMHQMQNLIKIVWGRENYNIDQCVSKIVSCGYNINDIKKLRKDITLCYIKNLAKPSEYFLLNFHDKTGAERKCFLTDIEKDMYCNKHGGHDKFDELTNKYLFYERMKFYYKRDAILINNKSPKETFVEFAKKHNKFIIKPNRGSFGKNTAIIDATGKDLNVLFNELISEKAEWILEELIVQVPEIAQFNLSSVNSVRVPTFRTKKGIEVFGTFMRTGRKGSVVDNAGVGGIFMRVDENTGVINSEGYTEFGQCYEIHPDSEIKFKGFQIPHWNDLILLAKECHNKLPNHKYIGWDFVLTVNGWVLMEGNWGQFLCQQVSGKEPLKQQFLSLLMG